jgi:hypothetical protein
VTPEHEVRISPLCRNITRSGHKIRVEIYEGDPGKWILEVVDRFHNSTIWDEQFDTDAKALAEVERTIAEEGITALVGAPSSTAR